MSPHRLGRLSEETESPSLMDSSYVDAMIDELETEADDQIAVRKALLFLIRMVQAELPEVADAYVGYLLTKFRPVSDHFKDDLHPLTRQEDVLRARIMGGRMVLLSFWRGPASREDCD